MTHPGRHAGLDLRSGDLRVAVRGADGTVSTTGVPAAAALVDGRLVLGGAAAKALVTDPSAGWSNLLDRVGDPVPIRLGAEALPAADLVARTVAGCLSGPVGTLAVMAPEAWSADHRRRLSAALLAAGLPTPRWVAPEQLLAPAPDRAAGDHRVLLLTTGAKVTTARVLSPADGGWRVDGSQQVDFGSDTVRSTTYGLAATSVSEAAGRALTPAEARILGAICAPAADKLPGARRLDLNLPGLPGARLNRSDVEDALAPRLKAAFGGLTAAFAAQGVTSLPSKVLLEGSGTRLPVVATAISEALGRPVEGVATEVADELTLPEIAELGRVEPVGAASASSVSPPADQTSATAVLPAVRAVPTSVDATIVHAEPEFWDESPRFPGWVKPAAAAVLVLGLLGGVGFAARGQIQSAIAGLTGSAAASVPGTVAPSKLPSAPRTLTTPTPTPTATTLPSATATPSPAPTTTAASTSTKATTTKSTTTTKATSTSTTTDTTTTDTTEPDTTDTTEPDTTDTSTTDATDTTDPAATP